MKRLYAPWRSEYTMHVAQSKQEYIPSTECIFCQQFNANQDDVYFILKRTAHHVIMLNKYPYNAGHLLILPFDHVATLDQLRTEVRAELIELTNFSINMLQETINPHGFNIGLNLGKAAGAGIPSHLHMHVLPRFNGDTNFLPLLADTKQISFDLHDLFIKLKEKF